LGFIYSTSERGVGADDDYDKYVGKSIGPGMYYASFMERQKALEEDGETQPEALEALEYVSSILYPSKWLTRLHQNIFTQDMKRDVEARDGGICFIHGRSTNNTTISWLVPPLLAEEVRSNVPGAILQ